MKYNYLPVLLSLLLFVGCSKEKQWDIDRTHTEYFIFALLTPNTRDFRVELSPTSPLYEPIEFKNAENPNPTIRLYTINQSGQKKLLTDAFEWINYQGANLEDTTFRLKKSFFYHTDLTSFTLDQSLRYQLEIEFEDDQKIQSQPQTFPDKVPITKTTFKPQSEEYALTFADPGGSYNYYSFQARMKEYVNEDDPLETFFYSLHSIPFHNLVDDTLFDGNQEVVFSDEFYVLDGSIAEKIILNAELFTFHLGDYLFLKKIQEALDETRTQPYGDNSGDDPFEILFRRPPAQFYNNLYNTKDERVLGGFVHANSTLGADTRVR